MNKQREELLRLLAELSDRYPDMRFGQLTVNVAQWARGPIVSAAWDVTDEEMIAAAQKNLSRSLLGDGFSPSPGKSGSDTI